MAAKASQAISRINLAELTIVGCTGCYACQAVAGEPGCVQKDEASVVYQGMIGADQVIISTPLYCWSHTALTQAAIERCIALVSGYGTDDFTTLVKGKSFALLVTSAGPIENNVDLLPIAFKRMCGFLQAKAGGSFILPGTTTPAEITPAAEKLARTMMVELLG